MGVGNALLVFIFIVSFFFFVLLMLAIMPNYGFFIFIVFYFVFYFVFYLIESVLLISSSTKFVFMSLWIYFSGFSPVLHVLFVINC